MSKRKIKLTLLFFALIAMKINLFKNYEALDDYVFLSILLAILIVVAFVFKNAKRKYY